MDKSVVVSMATTKNAYSKWSHKYANTITLIL